MPNTLIVKKLMKVGLNAAYVPLNATLRATGLIDAPVPPNSSMRKTGSKGIRQYFASGIRTYLPIATAAEWVGVDLRAGGKNVLDFGCGVARQLLHFTRHYPDNQYFACDVDDTSIGFIRRAYPRVEAYANGFSPPLEYGDASFDMVYSVSIFSHLNPLDQSIWLDELSRVTKPGGYLFLTTEGTSALPALTAAFGRDEASLREVLSRDGMIYREYEGWKREVDSQQTLRIASSLVGVERSYGNTVVSADYVRETWSNDDRDVIQIVEGIIDNRQDLVVIRKRA
jgi:ubiquinone/menaquinone biosynthesis C-methylase UbiE